MSDTRTRKFYASYLFGCLVFCSGHSVCVVFLCMMFDVEIESSTRLILGDGLASKGVKMMGVGISYSPICQIQFHYYP